MECRIGCAACCIVISISSPIPGMPKGKPAGVRCIQLTEEGKCRIFGQPERPDVCSNLMASEEMCGRTNEEAHANLTYLESAAKPS
jgi:Fe-S-cluster containining protein